MMTNTSRQKNVTGDAIRADSYYGYTDGLHTVAVHFSNLTGRFHLQGTLSMNPTENDWFDIYLGGGQQDPFIQYPKDPGTVPKYANGGWAGDTGVNAFTFTGNFTFIRAKLDREYLGNVDVVGSNSLGVIDKVLLPPAQE